MKFFKSYMKECKTCQAEIHMTQFKKDGRWSALRADPRALKDGLDLKDYWHKCEDTINFVDPDLEKPKPVPIRPPVSALEVDSGDYFMQRIHSELMILNGYMAELLKLIQKGIDTV
jgi:hypothetical protein